jgi:hypothetical protein
MNVKSFVIKVAKCKQSNILTSIQTTKLNQYNCTNYQQATKAKDGKEK